MSFNTHFSMVKTVLHHKDNAPVLKVPTNQIKAEVADFSGVIFLGGAWTLVSRDTVILDEPWQSRIEMEVE